jgi:hypothetical protein
MNDHIPDATKMINDTPAFPCVYYSEPIGSIGPQLIIKGGMTLRDYFAAEALKGLLASIQPNQLWSGDDVAVTCYRTADAMLKARECK